MTMTLVSAWVFGVLTTVTILFQFALAFGAPWGEFTLGGRHRGVLPGAWRFVPVGSAAVLAAFMAVVFTRAGLFFPEWVEASRTLIWLVVGYCALGCIANTATRSPRERLIWLPVVAVLLITSLIVAFSDSDV